ncbi:hypothetical protein LWI28_004397 [Acer negundo]|uniref:PGG domain-containing protein n=1 Tax=Acer negundo TaxID=4023 RepID=A0AAD5NS38_ACENE|nr:hypothetical protein LWI28_004397 [Acer negundo]KAK4848470.1 hypothetical protein QYF36_013471 [Acer negundo]
MTNHDSRNVDDSDIISRIGECIKQWFIQDFKDTKGDSSEAADRELAAFRNNMLVVATLIVAATFQTGINPPGGAWQETKDGAGSRKGHSRISPPPFSIQLVPDPEHTGI